VSRSSNATRHSTAADSTAAVDAFMLDLEHPHKRAIEAIRHAILGAAPGIAEGIKWNAPSFRTHEYFATFNLREKAGIGLILHLGAKVKADDGIQLRIGDPGGLLHWLATDRARVSFNDLQDFEARRDAFVDLIQTWAAQV